MELVISTVGAPGGPQPPLQSSFCAPEVLLNFSGINLAEKTLSWLQIQQPVSGVCWIYRLSGSRRFRCAAAFGVNTVKCKPPSPL